MAEDFAKYPARNFAEKLDKCRSMRVGRVTIRHLVMQRAPYDLLKFKTAEVKEPQHAQKLNLHFLLAKIFNKAYIFCSNGVKVWHDWSSYLLKNHHNLNFPITHILRRTQGKNFRICFSSK